MRRLAVLLLMFPVFELLAQQDPQFSHYMFNNMYFNPAFSGSDGFTRLTALHRTQWLGYQPSFDDGGAPSTQLMTFQTPLTAIRSGIGAYIANDRLGPLNNLEIQGNYAWYKTLGSGRLSAGLRAGLFSQTVNFDRYRAVNPDDPLITARGKATQTRPDLGAGVAWQSGKYYVGASMMHLLPVTFDFNLNQAGRLKPHLYITGGYTYEVNFDLKIQFLTLAKSDLAKTTFDVGGIAYLRNTMWGGLSFRESEAAILMIGYSLLKDKSLKAGYSVDFIVKDRVAKQPTSHEFMLFYDLPTSTAARRKVIRTPRYRY